MAFESCGFFRARGASIRRKTWGGIAIVSLFAAVSSSLAVLRDTAIYPVSGHAPDDKPAAALRFDTLFEATIPGLPTGPLRVAPDGSSYTVQAMSGAYLVDANGRLTPMVDTPASNANASSGCSWQAGRVPRWLLRLSSPALSGPCVEGPQNIVGILAKDGTVYGRDRRNGHLLWRRMAPHRISRDGASLGPYLFIAPDASRTLEALRWSDGSVAGVFQLDSEDASFASSPVLNGERIAILAVQSPRKETRLLVLRVHPETTPTQPPSVPSAGQG